MTAPTNAAGAGNVRMLAFYALVAVVALIGQVQAATIWLGWPMVAAVAAVGAVEFGGIILSVQADSRRQLGERAYTYRVLSAVVAIGAVVINALGHLDNPYRAGFFAGMSGLGYVVWVVRSGDQRRDALRAAKMLPPVPPAYGAEWIRHPIVTRRARAIFLRDAEQRISDDRLGIGLYESLDAARAEIRMQKRNKAVRELLRRQLAGGAASALATTAYDLDRLAEEITAQADYDGLAALIGAELRPTRLVSSAPQIAPVKADASAEMRTGSSPAKRQRGRRVTVPASNGKVRRTAEEMQAAVAAARDASPEATQKELASAVGVSERHLRTILQRLTAPAAAV